MRAMTYILTGMLGLCISCAASADGTLSDNIRIESKSLGYGLQYRVYAPDPKYSRKDMATLYITDGQGYIAGGKLPQLLDREIKSGRIEPIIAIFVDARSPDNLKKNRRNQQFFCNPKYAAFYENELVPTISKGYDVLNDRDGRVILGLSFGGMNSACFGYLIPEVFGGVAMQSPANAVTIGKIVDIYKAQEKIPIKIFLSYGTIRDNILVGRRFMEVLKAKGYDLTYREVKKTHNWKNWGPLLDDVLVTFFSK